MKKQHQGNNTSPSLSKYLANCGVSSRRKATELILEGEVTINGEIIKEPGYRLHEDDLVRYKGKIIKPKEKRYILLNKPAGFITAVSDDRGRKTVMHFLKGIKERVYPIGRLDRNTTGLLLLTNDGELAQRLAHPRYKVKKVYHVILDHPLAFEHADAIRKGFRLHDGWTKVDGLRYMPGTRNLKIRMILHSGRNRIIRRIFEHFEYRVRELERVSYAELTLKGVRKGEWRLLKKDEIAQLKALESVR